MSILGQLDTLRQNVPGCTLVAFADLRTRLVLTVSTDKPRPQERLDEMCFQAADCFDDCDTLAAALCHDKQNDVVCSETTVLTPAETRVFVRSPDGEGEALFCVCHPTVQIDELTREAGQTLQQISGML